MGRSSLRRALLTLSGSSAEPFAAVIFLPLDQRAPSLRTKKRFYPSSCVTVQVFCCSLEAKEG